jgi:cell division protein YceG involved in septum cleavage
MNYQRAQIHQKKLSTYIKILAPTALVILWAILWIMWAGSTPVNTEKTLTIPRGTTLNEMRDVLGIDMSETRYKLWNMFFAPDIVLKTGYFQMPEGTNTLKGVYEALENPIESEEDITLLPGWHKGEMDAAFDAKNLEGDLLTDEQSLITQFTGEYPFLTGKTTLEGFLMPDTYRITG